MTAEEVMAYIQGNNEAVAMLNEIVQTLDVREANGQPTLTCEEAKKLVFDAFFTHMGTGQVIRATLDAETAKE